MSEHMPEQAGAEVAATQTESTTEPAPEVRADVPAIAPDHEAPPKPDAPKADGSGITAPKIETPKIDTVKSSAAGEPGPGSGKLIVMAPSDRAREGGEFAPRIEPEAKQHDAGKRRLSAMAAVIALAAAVGAVSAALATAGVMHFAANEAPASIPDVGALQASVARIDADIVALKAGLDHTSKAGLSQLNKTNDRLDRLEKTQAEPLARLAKLSEAVDKLRATVTAPLQAASAKDTTGSLAPAQVAAAAPAGPAAIAPAAPAATATAATAPPKVEIGRLPTVEGWRLRDIANGGALIEGRSGLYEVYAGDPVPGLGRVDAIRRQDGRWVVITSKGLIVAR